MALTAKRIAKLLRKGEPGRHFDGLGLYLVIESRTSGRWERRYQLHEKEHYLGLGGARLATFQLDGDNSINASVSIHLAGPPNKSPVKTIARAMKRTPAAPRQKAFALGLPLGHRQ
jgi:hypothetical protein